MSSQEKNEYLIDQYISGQLDGEELTTFQQMLERDKDLQKEVDFQQELKDTILDQDVMDFRKNIQQTVNEKRKGSGSTNLYRLAAAIVPIIVATWVFFNYNQNEMSNQQVFVEYLQPYENLLTVRSDGNTDLPPEQENLNSALSYYDKGKYKEALVYFNKLDVDQKDLVALYKGISHLFVGESELATQVLEIPAKSNDGVYKYPALYYQALSWINQEDTEKAIDILRELREEAPMPYRKFSEEILENID